MKGITAVVTMGNITDKKDGSLSFRVDTPEVTNEELADLRNLKHEALKLTLTPINLPNAPMTTVKAEKDVLTPSQRLRNALFALHRSKLELKEYIEPDFEIWYRNQMESFIDMIKAQLDNYKE
jgi:hypothetical protein